ncbi:TPA: hypothetical protein N0F65_005533 [Lagenidium giganteum]|uniref:YCII-related domain-containing protein n=1 Tax=Lagenidium giganteum TaxID=4803 RepID=A0AAV2YTF9_9STRA|nr:TPA: hypothetical protein N0F65_005533 [Lagenidium giganteum]
MSTSTDKKHFILRYDYIPEILEKRGPFRAEHLELAKTAKAHGKVLMAGALVDPADGGVFIFHTNDKRDVEDFVNQDPYVKNALVTSYTIREWMVVV